MWIRSEDLSDTVVSMVRDPFLNTDDACGYLGVPKATLLTWRVRRPGYGPRAVKAGGRLKYRLSELDRWLDAHEESFNPGGILGPHDPYLGESDEVVRDILRGRLPT